MKNYDLPITEKQKINMTVDTSSRSDAEQIASDNWNQGLYTGKSDVFDSVEFEANESVETRKQLEVLLVEPGKYPRTATIDAGLESLQSVVGGYIEVVSPFDDGGDIVCNEEGKLCGLPLNRAIRDEDGEVCDIIAGTFFVVGSDDGEFVSLPKELQKPYEDRFKRPEYFMKMGRGIMAIPYDPKGESKEPKKHVQPLEL